VGISADYRNTDKCHPLSDVSIKKNTLCSEIKAKYRKLKIMYRYVRDKNKEYFKKFAEIYNYKCAYCGAILKFTDIRLLEVDHFICESKFPKNTEGRAEAGKIENLIFSCYSCNRGKHGLHIEAEHQSILYPDDNSIAAIFCRSEDYYIKINDAYSDNAFISQFYEKLSLGNEARRIDYLLLEMHNFISELQSYNPELASKLEQCKGRLLEKKNYMRK